MRTIVALALALGCAPAMAHNEWADGSAIPDWVKASCCGSADAHHLRPDQVHQLENGDWRVDGVARAVPAHVALSSQDGGYWIFYGGADCAFGDLECDRSQTLVYCFFVPMNF